MLVIDTLTVMCCVVSAAQQISAETRLVAPESIQAFSEDVVVHAYDATIGNVVELFFQNQTKAITAQVITTSPQSAMLIFNCGYFFQTGTYFFNLRSEKGATLAKSRQVRAQESSSILTQWEEHHEALTTDVKVSFKVKSGMCKSDIARQNKVFLKLLRIKNTTGLNLTVGEKTTAPGSKLKTYKERRTIQTTDTFPVSTSATFIPPYLVLPCESFPTAGRYQAELIATSPNGDDVKLSESDVMTVEWSRNYDLKLQTHAFPCSGSGVSVDLSYPPCAPVDDLIRLLSVSDKTIKMISTQRQGAKDRLSFPCSEFYSVNTTVEGFCFQYVTKGHVTRSVCKPASDAAGFKMYGLWSPWTDWTTCERPCVKKLQRKKRICDNPEPYGDDRLCVDSWGKPSLEELISKVDKSEAENCADDALTSQHDQQCDCGCSIQTEDRGVIVSPLTGNCDSTKTLIWTVSVPTSHSILFELTDYQLAGDEVLTIRDGAASWRLTSQVSSVTSQNHIVIVQWVQSREKNNLKSCGFILSFDAKLKPTSSDEYETTAADTGGEDFVKWIEKAVEENPVVLGGIGACVVIIVVVIVVVAIHCRRRSNGKTKIPAGLRTPMNARLAVPPDGRSCSNADDTESEPMVRPRPIGNIGSAGALQDNCIPMQPSATSGTAYYLAQRQLELMRRMGKDEHSQTYATGCLSEDTLRQQEDLLFGDRRSLHNKEDLRVT